MEAVGQFRSYNRHEGTKNRLMLSVFVREIHFMDEFTDYTKTKPDLLRRLYLQGADLPQNTSWKRDRRPSFSCKPSLWKIRLYPLYQLGP